MRSFIIGIGCLLACCIFSCNASAEPETAVVRSETTPELVSKNRFVVEGFGKGSLAVGSLTYERVLSELYAFGFGIGLNPAESLRVGSHYKTGIISLPVYFVVTPWSGQLRPYLTGGFDFQIGIGPGKRGEPNRTFVQKWINRSRADFGRILYQGPALMGGLGLEYRFVGDWLIRATGYGLYFMESETLAPWAGLSIGKQF